MSELTIEKKTVINEDLNDPKHDEILIWLDANIEKVIYSIVIKESWESQEIESLKASAKRLIESTIEGVEKEIKIIQYKAFEYAQKYGGYEKFQYHTSYEEFINKLNDSLWPLHLKIKALEKWCGIGEPPAKPKIKITSKVVQFPFNKEDKIHFVDLKVDIKEPELDLTSLINEVVDNESVYKIGWNISFNDGGFWDRTTSLFFIIRPEIVSISQLIRDIRSAQSSISLAQNGKFIVVCPNDKYKDILVSQGFYFYKYEE